MDKQTIIQNILKAKGRMSDGGKGKENFPDLKGQTRDIVASKLGIGSGKQGEKKIE